jgi:hypothetical protein
MSAYLTPGGVSQLCAAGSVAQPNVQFLEKAPMGPRYRAFLSDGDHFVVCITSPGIKERLETLKQFAIIRITRFTVNTFQVNGQNGTAPKAVIVLEDFQEQFTPAGLNRIGSPRPHPTGPIASQPSGVPSPS